MEPRGIRNNNPGNLRRTKDPWQGLAAQQNDGEFFQFESAVYGLRAVARTLITYQDRHGLETVRQLIERWAPPTENHTEAYVRFAAKAAGVAPDAGVDVHRYEVLRPLVVAIVRFENGMQPYSDAQIDKALALAGVEPPAKPLSQSRTVKGSQAATAGVVGSVAAEAASQIEPLVAYSDVLKWMFVGLTLLGIGVTIYARWDDRRKLAR